jgi:hypothetical protein
MPRVPGRTRHIGRCHHDVAERIGIHVLDEHRAERPEGIETV